MRSLIVRDATRTPKRRGKGEKDLRNKKRILSKKEATSWSEGIDGNHEEIAILINTILFLYEQISKLENGVVKSDGQGDFGLI